MILHAIDAHTGGVLESEHFIEDSRTLSQLQAALEEMLRVPSDLDEEVVPGFLVSDSDEDSDDEAARQVILHDLDASEGGHIDSDVPIEDTRTLEELEAAFNAVYLAAIDAEDRADAARIEERDRQTILHVLGDDPSDVPIEDPRTLEELREALDELQRVPLVSDSDEGTDDEDDDPLDDPFEPEPVESDVESETDSEPEEVKDEDEEVKDEDEAAAISNAQIRALVRKCLLGENFGSSDDSSDGGNEDSDSEDSDVSEDDEDEDKPFEFSFDDDDDEYFSFHEEDEMIV